MIDIITARLKQGHRTMAYPAATPMLPERFQGQPSLNQEKCKANWDKLKDICPTEAISRSETAISIDLGRCLFCGSCEKACAGDGIKFSNNHKLSTRTRNDLVLTGNELNIAKALEKESLRLFGHSLKLREVSAAGCNA